MPATYAQMTSSLWERPDFAWLVRYILTREWKEFMAQNGSNGTPAYKRIRGVIWKRIEEVERRRGAGTFVAPPKIHFNKLMSYSEQMASRGLVAASQLLCCKIIDYEPEIAARLSATPNSRLVKVERLRHAANEPFALEACYLSAEEFSGLTSAPLGRSSLFSTLERDFGVELAHADEEVDATAADPRTAELLAVARNAPLLRIRQVIYSTKGKATIYVLGFYRSDRHTLLIRRFR